MTVIRKPAAFLLAALVCAACTNDLVAPAPTLLYFSPSSTPTLGIATPTASATPQSTPQSTHPTSNPPTMPADATSTPLAGWKVLATGSNAGAAWSREGTWLLAWGDGLHLDDAAGNQVRTVPGGSAVWLDSRSYVIFNGGTTPELGAIDSDTLTPIENLRVPFDTEPLSNVHGAVALSRRTDNGQFRIWTASSLTPWQSGLPMAWSRDGTEIAIWHFTATGGGTGGGEFGWVEVLRWPALTRVATIRGEAVDDRGFAALAFDPTGRFLAFHDAKGGPDGILDVKTGAVARAGAALNGPFAWNAESQLLVATDDGSVTTVRSDGTAMSRQAGLGDSICASADGTTVATWYEDAGNSLELLRADGASLLSWPDQPWGPPPLLSPNGTRLAVIDPPYRVLLREEP